MRADRTRHPAAFGGRMARLHQGAAGLGVLAGLLTIGFAGVAAGAPAGGVVRVIGVPNNGRSPVVFTGAVGDYGTATRQNANGAANRNGNYVRFNLKRGTFVGNGTVLFAKTNSATPAFNRATCSGQFSATAPMPLSSGTGLYAGISGTLNVRLTFAFVGPRFKSGKHKGQCNAGQNATPLAQMGSISGSGRVSFG